jgi:hypothetical protein
MVASPPSSRWHPVAEATSWQVVRFFACLCLSGRALRLRASLNVGADDVSMVQLLAFGE